jgi:hypothetical protein
MSSPRTVIRELFTTVTIAEVPVGGLNGPPSRITRSCPSGRMVMSCTPRSITRCA